MGFEELDDILAYAGGSRRDPCLVELGRALHPDGATTGYVWSTGEIGATVGAGWVRLRHSFLGENLTVTRRELRALDAACRDWMQRRRSWAEFSCEVGSLGLSRHYWYRPPGARGKLRSIGQQWSARDKSPFRGAEHVARLERAIEVAKRVRVVAEIWRRGESYGPKEGSLVGAVYAIGNDGLKLRALRDEVKASRRKHVVWLNPDLCAFVSALVRLTARGQRSSVRRTASRASEG